MPHTQPESALCGAESWAGPKLTAERRSPKHPLWRFPLHFMRSRRSKGPGWLQALAAASEKVGSLAAEAAALQAEKAAHLAWTGRSIVLASLENMEVRAEPRLSLRA